jgi:hypothetical protein
MTFPPVPTGVKKVGTAKSLILKALFPVPTCSHLFIYKVNRVEKWRDYNESITKEKVGESGGEFKENGGNRWDRWDGGNRNGAQPDRNAQFSANPQLTAYWRGLSLNPQFFADWSQHG